MCPVWWGLQTDGLISFWRCMNKKISNRSTCWTHIMEGNNDLSVEAPGPTARYRCEGLLYLLR